MISSFDLNDHSEYNDNMNQFSILAMSQNNLSLEEQSNQIRLRKPVKQFKMGEPQQRGISSNSMKSN